MTISSSTNRWAYVGNGVTASFPYTNRIFAATDLLVYLDGVLQATGYSVTPVGASGAVVFGDPPGVDVAVTIVRSVPLTQPQSLPNLGAFNPETVMLALDRLCVEIQQNYDLVQRSLRLEQGEATAALVDLPSLADRASTYLGFDADGQPVALAAPGDTTAVSVFAAALLLAADAAAARATLGALEAALVSPFMLTLLDDLTASAAYTTLGLNGNLFRRQNPNGAMAISVRPPPFAGVGATDGQYTLDLWRCAAKGSASGRFTVSHESSGGVSGKAKWLKALCSTADAAPGAAEALAIETPLEAQNVQALVSATGKIVAFAVSFDIIAHADAASSITFPAKAAVYARTADGTARQYVADVTIAAADAWQRVTVLIPADSVGTIDHDTGLGLVVGVALYGGSGVQATEATWENDGGDYVTASSANWADATNNYLGITLVQVEPGAVATAFEHRPLPAEQRLCQRYAWDPCQQAAGTFALASASGSAADAVILLPVEMRVEPTLTISDIGHFQVNGGGAADVAPSGITLTGANSNNRAVELAFAGLTNTNGHCLRVVGSSGSARLLLEANF